MHMADDAAACALIVHDQVEREIFDEELRRMAQRLAVQRVQHGVAGAVGGGAGALRGRAFAEIGGHAAERALIDLAFLGAREGHAVMLQLIDGGGRVAAEIFDGVLVAEPVGALHRVVHVPAPVVRPHIAERGRDAALRRDRMRAGREHLGDAGRLQSRFGAAERGAQARSARPDHHHVIGVIGERIGAAVGAWRGDAVALAVFRHAQAPRLNLMIATTQVSATATAKKVFRITRHQLRALLVDVVLDDDLHAEPHMIGGRNREQRGEDGDERRSEIGADDIQRLARQPDHGIDQEDEQDQIGEAGDALSPEMFGAGAGRPQALDARERGAVAGHQKRPPLAQADEPDDRRQRQRADERAPGHQADGGEIEAAPVSQMK